MDDTTQTRSNRIFTWMSRRPAFVLWGAVTITTALAIPFLTMQPEETASSEPGGTVFEARDQVAEQFSSSVRSTPVIVEARDGNMLTKSALLELFTRSEALRDDPVLAPTLFRYYDADTDTDIVGVRSIADLVAAALPAGIEAASQEDIDAAVLALAIEYGPASDQLGLSVATTQDPVTGGFVSPAVIAFVLSDNTVLGFADTGVTLGADTEPEEYSREIVAAMRGDENTYQAWGVAIDVNLTSAEQGEVAGPYIGLTILAVLMIVGLVFRSYWSLAVTGAALSALFVWLYGISNLIGLKDDLVLSLLVPIAMISFGVDFTFHALGRYGEERKLGMEPRRAFTVGLTAVSGALVLALLSDTAAFLSNASSGIESIIQFGVGASIALAAAFLLLGIVTPLAMMVIEDRVGAPPQGRTRAAGRVGAATLAGMAAMTIALLMVFIYPLGGVVALAVYILAFLVAPARLSHHRPWPKIEPSEVRPGRIAHVSGVIAGWLAGKRRFVIPLAAGLTLAAAFLAVRVPTEFDVEDFFSPDTDFVVSLNKLDQHVGDRGGEPATVYVRTDLTDPTLLARLAVFSQDLERLSTPTLARDADGKTRVEGSVFEVFDHLWASPTTLAAIETTTGVTVTDEDGDGIPDDGSQLQAVYGYTRVAGISLADGRFLSTPDDVRSRVWQAEDGQDTATLFVLGLTNTRRQEAVAEARNALDPLIEGLRVNVMAFDSPAVVELTGAPIVRQQSLEAISRALQVSLPIAVVLCLLIATAFMRSFKLALVSVAPILMTVAWLYAFMELAGFSINIVTATIGAVSIGIGIDFAIHYTMRYREELSRGGRRLEAVRRTAEGTGIALLASTASSAIGFAILAFAPMPLFASYGLLTAIMIVMAAASTLLVLPSLLTAVTSDDRAVATATSTAEPAAV